MKRLTLSRTIRTLALGTVVVIAATGCAAAAPSSGGTDADGRISVLRFGDFGGGTNPKQNYNPFLEGTSLSPVGYIFEPLMSINEYSCDAEPWLASDYAWSDDKTLVFTLRDGVTFNDGEAFTSEDVAFTFDMIKKNPALDTQGIWRYLSAVEATDKKTVTFRFTDPGASAFTLVNTVKIVPEHIWGKVKNPTTFTNAKAPVGTGPMKIKSFNPQRLVIERNADYWQADKIQVNTIQFTKSDSGQVEQLKLGRGDYDSNGSYIPDIEKAYVAKDKKHHKYWFPAGSPISLFMNVEKAPFSDVAFRSAISVGLDRQGIADGPQQGYVDVASQTGLVLPNSEDWLPADIKNEGFLDYDKKAASDALTDAGYKLDSEGKRLDTAGQPMTFTFEVPSGWNDWVLAAKVLQKNLIDLGIGIDLQTPTAEVMEQDRRTGQYDFVFGVRGGSCNMFRNFSEPLASDQTAPTGQAAATNEVRWRDAKTDALIEQLRSGTDEAAQKKSVAGLARIMVEQVPYIPLWYGANWFQYSTKNAVGWPSEKDPYAKPANILIMLTHLKPAGK